MREHIRTIAWVQFRTMRNHLPRTSVGSAVMFCLTLLWYGMYAGMGIAAATLIPQASYYLIRDVLPVVLLVMGAVWQIVPLLTLSAGWSLEVRRLQIYPVRTATLFLLETVLRLTASPEMILVLLGVMAGLMRHPHIPWLAPVLLLLYVPLNLFLSLALREVVLSSIGRGRLREIVTLLFISVGVLPQLLIRGTMGPRVRHAISSIAQARGAPWSELAALGMGIRWLEPAAVLLIWTALAYAWAKWQFERSLRQEELSGTPARAASGPARPYRSLVELAMRLPARVLPDPLAALVEKEIRSLFRMPRFRVIFGMACIFSVLIFIPMVLRDSRVPFIADHFLPMVSVYGLLLLGEVLLFNVFGFDRRAAQLYFVAPMEFRTVLRAKNIVALAFILLQTFAVIVIASVAGIRITGETLADTVGVAAVVAVFFLAAGNLTSVTLPKPMNPNETFRKQAGAKLQLWVMASFFGLSIPIGMAYLAGWALRNHWAFWGVLAIDFVIGMIVYRIALDSAVARGVERREELLDLLGQGSDPVGV